ncbi:MAG: DUF402 domain-containing protein [Dehalococcoidia bacterium]
MKRSAPGAWIELREVWDSCTWEIRRGFVVEDTTELLATYTPPGSAATIAVGPDGTRLRLPPDEWPTAESAIPANRRFLGLHPPGAEHSVLVIWDDGWQLVCWYINMESDLERTDHGIQYVDHFLDVVVYPTMASWRWKDEDELAEAVERRLITANQAGTIRAEGERALEWLLARRPPYDRPWDEWRPPTEWG